MIPIAIIAVMSSESMRFRRNPPEGVNLGVAYMDGPTTILLKNSQSVSMTLIRFWRKDT